MLTNLHYISLLFTNSISSDNFCWCKNKRHFFNLNICTCFNFREILTSVQSHLRKEGVSGTFFRHYNGNRKWCVICTAPYSKYIVQTEAEDRATQIRGEPTKKKVFSAMELRKGPSESRTHWTQIDLDSKILLRYLTTQRHLCIPCGVLSPRYHNSVLLFWNFVKKKFQICSH